MPGRANVFIHDYSERFRDDESNVWIEWDVPWSIRNAWRQYCLGYARVLTTPTQFGPLGVPIPGVPFISRITPLQHPELPYLYASEIELVEKIGIMAQRDDVWIMQEGEPPPFVLNAGGNVQGPNVPYLAPDGRPDFWPMPAWATLPAGPGLANYGDGYARFRVTYRDLRYEVLSDAQLSALAPTLPPGTAPETMRFVERNYNYATKTQDLPLDTAKNLVFVEGPVGIINKPVNQGVLLIRPLLSVEMTWKSVPRVPWDAITDCIGHVNSLPFDLGSNEYYQMAVPEQAYCMAPKAKWYRDKTGHKVWDVQYTFNVYTTTTWNAFPAIDGLYHTARFPDGTGLYKQADFNTLFEID
jgi:hypothetical protein